MEGHSLHDNKSLLSDISNKDVFRVPDLPNNAAHKKDSKKRAKAQLIEQNKIKMIRRLESRKMQQSKKGTKLASSSVVDLKATEESFIQLNNPEQIQGNNKITCGPGPDVEFSDISAIHSETFRNSIEPTKGCFMTSTPARIRHNCSPIPGSPSQLNQSTYAVETIDERLMRQMDALGVWCNMMLKTSSEFDELDLGKTKKEASKKLQELLNGKPIPVTKVQKKTYKDFLHSQERASLRKRSSELFAATGALPTISGIVLKDGLSIRDTCSVYSEIELKERLLHIFLSFHPAWLHIGLETVFNEEIQIPEGISWTSILSHFISTRVFSNPVMLQNKKFAYGDIRKIITPPGRIALHRHFLIHLSSFLFAVEFLKTSTVIKHDPPLFSRGSKFICLDDVFSALSKECLSGSGMTLGKMFFSKLGFKPSYKQGFLDNYDYTVRSFSCLLDGIILGKLVEITTGARSGQIMCKLRNPGGDRLRKVGNVSTVLNEAKIMRLDIDDVKPEEIVGGNKTTIIGLLWKIIGVYIVSSETESLRRESLLLGKINGANENGESLSQTPEEVVLRICQQIGEFAGLKVRSTADLKDGKIFAFAWRMYYPDAPDVNFFKGKTLFDKVVEASNVELGVPVGLSKSIVLFANLYLSRIFHQKRMKDAAQRIQRAFRGYRCLKIMKAVLESYRYTAGRESVSSVCSLQKTHIIENREIHIDDLPVVPEDNLSHTLIECGETTIFIGEEEENAAVQTLLLLGESSRMESSFSADILDATRGRAATRIQAAFRGYRCRELYKRALNQKKEEVRSVVIIQAAVRGFLERRSVLLGMKEFRLRTEAATKIQAVFRGFLARRLHKNMQKDLERAAVIIQSHVRGYLYRKALVVAQQEAFLHDRAATRLQNWYRMKQCQKSFGNLRNGHKAAITIQCAWRQYSARKQYLQLAFMRRRIWHEKREVAAARIQRWYMKCLAKRQLRDSSRREQSFSIDFVNEASLDTVIDGSLVSPSLVSPSEAGPSLLNEVAIQSSADESNYTQEAVSVRHIYEEIQREKVLQRRCRSILRSVKISMQNQRTQEEYDVAATIIQRWYRGFRCRQQHIQKVQYLKQFSDDYAKRVKEEAQNDSENLLTDRLTPAGERLVKASHQLFVSNVYGIKVAAFAINRLTELCPEVLVKFVCTLNGFGALLDRLESCDRGPALMEIAGIVLLTLRRIVENKRAEIERHVLEYGEDCVKILLHCILAYYNNSYIVEIIGHSLLALYRHNVLRPAFKKAPFYTKELSKKFAKLPNTDARVHILKKLKSNIL